MFYNIPENYMNILMRNSYDYEQCINNLVFMIGQHIEDKDDAFLNTELFIKLKNDLNEKKIQMYNYEVGIVSRICNQENINFYTIKDDRLYVEIDF